MSNDIACLHVMSLNEKLKKLDMQKANSTKKLKLITGINAPPTRKQQECINLLKCFGTFFILQIKSQYGSQLR